MELAAETPRKLRKCLQLGYRVVEVSAVRIDYGRSHLTADLVEEHEIRVHGAPIALGITVGDSESVNGRARRVAVPAHGSRSSEFGVDHLLFPPVERGHGEHAVCVRHNVH